MTAAPTVNFVTLGCARNDVDAEELAARLEAEDWRLVADGPADMVVVNTCGFVTSAKQESIDTILAAAGDGSPVVAVGCLAERYGRELAEELPEAAAVVGFDGYERLGATLREVLAGKSVPSHEPIDRRTLLPITPVSRPGHRPPPGHGATSGHRTEPGHSAAPGHPSGTGVVTPSETGAVSAAAPAHRTAGRRGPGGALPGSRRGRTRRHAGPSAGVVLPADETVLRRRLSGGPVAPLKIASGCDRRCAFCAIPRFRGAFVSRPLDDLVAEARWLAAQGVRELICVSENSTSYGKDLGDPRLLETLLPQLAAVEGIERVRLSYLQPAEMRPSLIEAMVSTAGVAPYFDLSFQHASGPLLRRMRRFGEAETFLDLVARIRSAAPEAGIRSNVIVGFPGESEADLEVLEHFLGEAQLDAVGVFGYSDEDGTEAAGLPGKLDSDEIAERVSRIADVADLVSEGRAADRKDTADRLLVESVAPASGAPEQLTEVSGGAVQGRCEFQGPEDGATVLVPHVPSPSAHPDQMADDVRPGDVLDVVITGADGVDLRAERVTRAGSERRVP